MTPPTHANDADTVAPFQRLGSVVNRIISDLDMDLVHQMLLHKAELREAAFRLQQQEAHEGLTQRQADALQFIHDHETRTGSAPTYRQIAEALCLKSTSGVHRIITGLEDRGAITRVQGKARTVRVQYFKGAQ
ncbi:MarR family transcriptional regulator [Aureimonas fodinaquatilis]|uniref:MarR family transcriptional regulator n=1 Tax=Aureimonas fodinaquatilis TaxID=2565783 RepID=A0A5B0DVR8_9HYPH|nr:MarR family transcriptional regulator [Aureimonas fodinaquatilis]KAA0970834.1 MarR family transcriptional regulator [Aureimonas fodinaquatilis]